MGSKQKNAIKNEREINLQPSDTHSYLYLPFCGIQVRLIIDIHSFERISRTIPAAVTFRQKYHSESA